MSDCKSTDACITDSGCSTEQKPSCAPSLQADCCPIEKSIEKWSDSFCQAVTSLQVEILKQRIKKSCGPQMEQVGDAIVEAMGIQWETMMSQGKSKMKLRADIKNIFCAE